MNTEATSSPPPIFLTDLIAAASSSAAAQAHSDADAEASHNKAVGLGVGLGFGLPVVVAASIGVTLLLLGYRRKKELAPQGLPANHVDGDFLNQNGTGRSPAELGQRVMEATKEMWRERHHSEGKRTGEGKDRMLVSRTCILVLPLAY